MATQQQHGAVVKSFTAGADLTGSQYLLVKMSGPNTVVPVTAVTDVPIGVLQNAPANGFEALVADSGYLKVIASAAIVAGAALGTDATGKVVTITPGTDTTKYLVGRAIYAASAANVVFQAQITIVPGRAS